MMKQLDGHFKKDRDSKRLEKATEYFRVRRDKEGRVSKFLVRHEKIRNDWKRMEGDQKEIEGLMVIHQAGINDNDYHVVMGMCSEGGSYENVWRLLKRIFGEKKTISTSCMGEEKTTRENSMGKLGKRLKCLNCLSEKHFIRDWKEEGICYIYIRKWTSRERL